MFRRPVARPLYVALETYSPTRCLATSRLVTIIGMVFSMFGLHVGGQLLPYLFICLRKILPHRTCLTAQVAVVFAFVAFSIVASKEDERVCGTSNVFWIGGQRGMG